MGQLGGEKAQAPGSSSLSQPLGPGWLTFSPFEQASSGPASLSWDHWRMSIHYPQSRGPWHSPANREGQIPSPPPCCPADQMNVWMVYDGEEKIEISGTTRTLQKAHGGGAVTAGYLHVNEKGGRESGRESARMWAERQRHCKGPIVLANESSRSTLTPHHYSLIPCLLPLVESLWLGSLKTSPCVCISRDILLWKKASGK